MGSGLDEQPSTVRCHPDLPPMGLVHPASPSRDVLLSRACSLVPRCSQDQKQNVTHRTLQRPSRGDLHGQTQADDSSRHPTAQQSQPRSPAGFGDVQRSRPRRHSDGRLGGSLSSSPSTPPRTDYAAEQQDWAPQPDLPWLTALTLTPHTEELEAAQYKPTESSRR